MRRSLRLACSSLHPHACPPLSAITPWFWVPAGGSAEDVYRGLRLLVGQDFFRVDGKQAGHATRFANNRASATLRTDHPNSVKYLASPCYFP